MAPRPPVKGWIRVPMGGPMTPIREALKELSDEVSDAFRSISEVESGVLKKIHDVEGQVENSAAPGAVAPGFPSPVPLSDGGTNASLTANVGGIFYSTASAGAILAGTATAGQILRSGASAAPSWSTATYPATATTAGTILRADGTNWIASTATYPNTVAQYDLLYGSSANTIAALSTANYAVLNTSSAGAPSLTATPTIGTSLTIGGTGPAVSGQLKLAGLTSGTVTVGVADAAGTWTLTLPTTDGDSGQVLQTDGAGVTSWATAATAGVQEGFFGDGTDGPVTISVNTTLSRDMYYSTLTVDTGITLNTANFRIFCTTTITNNGTIQNNGGNASGVTGGTAVAAGTLSTGANGGDGGNASAGSNGTGLTGMGGDGGVGGGSGGGDGGGSGGTVTAPAATTGPFRNAIQAHLGYLIDGSASIQQLKGGAGGGGGGQTGASGTGGGGGAGAGVLVICAKTITNTSGTIRANGGNGGDGSLAGGSGAGGGGGGGGGVVVLVYGTLDNVGGVEQAAGGTGGAAAGTGMAGADGQTGTMMMFQV